MTTAEDDDIGLGCAPSWYSSMAQIVGAHCVLSFFNFSTTTASVSTSNSTLTWKRTIQPTSAATSTTRETTPFTVNCDRRLDGTQLFRSYSEMRSKYLPGDGAGKVYRRRHARSRWWHCAGAGGDCAVRKASLRPVAAAVE